MAKKTKDWMSFLGKPGKTMVNILITLTFFAAAFAYLFWSIDIIPDRIGPVIGWIDDAIIFVIGGFIVRRAVWDTMKWLKKMKIL